MSKAEKPKGNLDTRTLLKSLDQLTEEQRREMTYRLDQMERAERAESAILAHPSNFVVKDGQVWAPAEAWEELMGLEAGAVKKIEGRHISSDEDFTVKPVDGLYRAGEIRMYYSYRFPVNFLKVLATVRPDLDLSSGIYYYHS